MSYYTGYYYPITVIAYTVQIVFVLVELIISVVSYWEGSVHERLLIIITVVRRVTILLLLLLLGPEKLGTGLGIRLFTFTTIGTLTNLAILLQNPKYHHVIQHQQQGQHQLSPLPRIHYGSIVKNILYSSRISTWIGLTITVFGPKVEVTYSIPLRYGPYDGRKLFQFGMSMSL